MLIETTPNGSNSVFERIRDRKAAQPYVLGTGLGDGIGRRLAFQGNNDRVQAAGSGWRTRARLSR
jgi:hypothetical protein